jgi:hypothetical protein
LEEGVLVRTTGVFSQLGDDVVYVELVRFQGGFIVNTRDEVKNGIVGTTTGTISTALRLELGQHEEQISTLLSTEINFSIRMHGESKRSLWGQFSLNILNVLLVRQGSRGLERNALAFNEGEHFSLVEERGVHQVFEIGCSETSVQVINNMTTVHDFTENVAEIVPWNLA